MANSTLEVLREARIVPEAPNDEQKHRRRLAGITGDWDYFNGPLLMEGAAVQWAKKGYVWAVGAKFVERFKYAASVRWGSDPVVRRSEGRFFAPVYNGDELSRAAIFYAGDIPEFALDRIESAFKDGLYNITIHSNQRLPVKRISLARIDPVIVAWPSDPDIAETGMPWSRHFRMRGHGYGFVIAAWDFDREIELSSK